MLAAAAALLTVTFAGTGPAAAQGVCVREISADVVALDQAVQFNRYGSHYPAWMIYALRGDVVSTSGDGDLQPGRVRLRDDHRPRPLALRMNVGDCLTIRFQNLLNPTPIEEYEGLSIDQPATRAAGFHVSGLHLTRPGMVDDASHVGRNASSLVAPGGSTTYRLHSTQEGVFLAYNPAVTTGGEANTGSLAYGMFGAVTVEPEGAEYYRSQVTRADLDLATRRGAGGNLATLPTGHPDIDYDAVFPADHPLAGRPILAMLQGTRIVHADLHAIITGPGRGQFTGPGFTPNIVLEPNRTEEQGPGAGLRTRREPFRELTSVFHDEAKVIQAFPQYNDPELAHTLGGVRDAFAINYGINGTGSQVLANRLGVGPTALCAECKYEEFFLSSWAGGDPALLVDVPANAALRSNGTVDPDAPRATRALYPADPANVLPSYLNDRLRIRNVHAGAEQHIFHLHAHQWLSNPDTPSSYLDSQFIAPGTGRTYEIAYNGSGNRNQLVGDSILHCHLYPHLSQGMWSLWRVHDTFERGTPLDGDGRAAPLSRAHPDGEIERGVAIYALVPIPGMALAPLPAPVRVEAGQVAFADPVPTGVDALGQPVYDAADNPGFPFFVPGQAGRRAPRPPMDTFVDDAGVRYDGGLPRHVGVGEGQAVAQISRLDMDKVLEELRVRWLEEDGEPIERAAMAFHGRRTHDSLTPEGRPRAFVTNGRPPVRGAPYADPCVTDTGAPAPGGMRAYRGASVQLRMTYNKAGWHFPQARISTLWNDVAATLDGSRPAEPLAMRAQSGECIEFVHTNLVPNVYELDDYQVRTPTDVISQHIHLVKFDVTSSDGASNGWNYEDATLAPGEVRERVAAIRAANACEAGASGRECPLAVPHPFFGEGPNGAWVGAMATVQRWYADPVMDERGQDRGLGTVFTHDHLGPATHQQTGLYGAIVIEPAGSTWRHPETGVRFSLGREDGGPTGWAANVITANPNDSFREYVLQIADFVPAYTAGGGVDGAGNPIPDPARVINPPVRNELGLPYLIERAKRCPGGQRPPCPEAIAKSDPGTFALNYRSEPVALRLLDPNRARTDGTGNGAQAAGRAGDPAYAFRSDVTRAMPSLNSQPTAGRLTAGLQPGDPWTPMLRAYKRDRVQVRILAGAHEEPHITAIDGMRWLFNADDPASGWRAAQHLGISEHFEFNMTVVPPEGDLGLSSDYLYSMNTSADGHWNGAWGLIRSYEFARGDLQPLPNNTPPAAGSAGVTARLTNLAEFNGVCPRSAPQRSYAISAVAASSAVGAQGIVYNDRPGNYRSQRGPLVDPTGAMYVLDSDLAVGADGVARLAPGREVEPLVLRAAAGDCILVTLTNGLPADWATRVTAPANQGLFALPFLVDHFNANQVTPSAEVGLHAQLVTADPTRSVGSNVGLNATTRSGVRSTTQTVRPGERITYRWYAGILDVTADNRLVATPVEFGATNLIPADRIRHSGKGLFGALVVLPQGATWVEDPGTRTQATVTTPNGRSFRDFVLMHQDDVNMQAAGRPVCLSGEGASGSRCYGLDDSQDAGHYAFNYRSEPLWARLGHRPGLAWTETGKLDYAAALANATAGSGSNTDPRTPIFRAQVGQELRFRLLQAGGHYRSASFTLHGHMSSLRPYAAGTVASQRIEGVWGREGYVSAPVSATREGIAPAQHFDVVVPEAGGPFRVTGDYLFRNTAPVGFEGGMWGLLRVTP